MLVVTHAHPDHTGSAINDFLELYIGAGDAASKFVAAYTGKIKELKDGDVIDLGGRTLDVVATPGHARVHHLHRQVGRLRVQRRLVRVGLNLVVTAYGVRINYSENSIQ